MKKHPEKIKKVNCTTTKTIFMKNLVQEGNPGVERAKELQTFQKKKKSGPVRIKGGPNFDTC